MHNRLWFAVLWLGILLVLTSGSVFSAPAQWGEQIAPGIEYRRFRLTGPINNVFVARMDRNSAANLAIESSLSGGNVADDTETVSDMAQRFDGAINYWDRTWGNRNQVAVAINGYYFDYGTETAYSGQIHSGWYASRFTDCATGSGGSGFAWKLDRSVFIGNSVSHPPDKQVVTFLDVEGEPALALDGLNVERDDNQLILYTPQYASDTGTDNTGVEVLVEMDAPAGVTDGGMVTGTVRQIRESRGSTRIPFDHVVLSAKGNARTELLDYVRIGDQIGVSQKIKSYKETCSTTPTGPDWTDTYASIAGAFYFLNDGDIRDFSDDSGAAARAPRTAVAYNDDYIFFIVVDGRDLAHSLGMSIGELAEFARDELGASYGIAEDGGGSSTMVINGKVVNNTYCNINTCQHTTYIPMVARSATLDKPAAPAKEAEVSPLPTDQPDKLSADGLPLTSQYYVYSQDVDGPNLQRLVANGLMMVVVQPRELSSGYIPGDQVKASSTTDLRLGPGSNYAITGSPVNSGDQGTILEHANGLNGVFATGTNWWKVDFNDTVGWINENSIDLIAR